MDEVYWDRDTVVAFLSETVEKPSQIAEILRFIEGCFVLSNADDAKVYIMEVDGGADRELLVEMTEFFISHFDLPIVFVPAGFMRYRATLKPETMGIKGKVMALRDSLRRVLNG